MRKPAIFLLVVVLVVPRMGSAATTQRVDGEVLAPTGLVWLATFNVWASCLLVDGTMLWMIDRGFPCEVFPIVNACQPAGAPNGTISYRFVVDPGTRGRAFTVWATDRPADLEITFRGSKTTRIGRNWLLGPNGSMESGRVPMDAKTADVCVSAGAGARFRYVAG